MWSNRSLAKAADAPLQELRGLVPRPLIEEAVATLCELLRAVGAEGPDDLDALVDDVAARDRARLGAVYDAMRDAEIFRRIVTVEPLVAAAREMVGARRLMSPFQHAVFRLDLASEGWRGFGWHQDFPYNVLCRNSVTAWLPLTPSGAANGGVEVALVGTDQIYPVEIRYKRDAAGRRLATRDAFIPERYHKGFEACAATPELAAGDVLMFRNTVVHRSGRNPGPRHRYSLQVRFGDLLAAEVVERRWRHRHADGFDTFAELHPELIAFKED
ncbi:MAG: Phytanoyl-CoA dioxygenase [Phenylobacterium sp.]|nr:Phytanoyl-CoA dioxygenase [Phenylobacterium sp.]